MPKDLERQRRLAGRLKESEERVGWLSDATLADKLDSWLGRRFGPANQPWALALIEADGTRRAIDPRVPLWALPLVFVTLGAGLALFSEGSGRWIVLGTCTLVAVGYYVQQTRAERHLLFDATRRVAIVHRGNRVLVEIPFEDIDAIFVEVRADPGYGDTLRAIASIGPVTVPLTMWTTDDAIAAADAVAKLTGIVREPELRRRVPET